LAYLAQSYLIFLVYGCIATSKTQQEVSVEQVSMMLQKLSMVDNFESELKLLTDCIFTADSNPEKNQ
jgi:hypothetical protein